MMSSMSGQQGTHFWFMTIQTASEDGSRISDYAGTVTPARGKTRMDMFNQVREEIGSYAPHTRAGAVLAFDLQPNKL
jgi:hypothetical protein